MKSGTRMAAGMLATCVAASAFAGGMVALDGGTPARAATVHVQTTPAQKTCAAFRAWDKHRSTANLDAMMTASERAPWHSIGTDVNVVYTDVRAGYKLDLAADVAGVRQDCHR